MLVLVVLSLARCKMTPGEQQQGQRCAHHASPHSEAAAQAGRGVGRAGRGLRAAAAIPEPPPRSCRPSAWQQSRSCAEPSCPGCPPAALREQGFHLRFPLPQKPPQNQRRLTLRIFRSYRPCLPRSLAVPWDAAWGRACQMRKIVPARARRGQESQRRHQRRAAHFSSALGWRLAALPEATTTSPCLARTTTRRREARSPTHGAPRPRGSPACEPDPSSMGENKQFNNCKVFCECGRGAPGRGACPPPLRAFLPWRRPSPPPQAEASAGRRPASACAPTLRTLESCARPS